VPVSTVVGYGMSALAVLFIWKYWDKISKEPVFLWLLIFFIYGMLITPFSSSPDIGFSTMLGYLAHWILPFILGYSVYYTGQARKLFLVIFAVISIITALSLLAYFGLFPKVVHGDFQLVRDGLLHAGRSHIAFAALCVFVSFFLIAVPVYSDKPGLKKLVWLVPAAVYIFAIILTGSRGYYISAAIVYSLFAVIWAVINKKLKYLIALAVAAGLCAALVYHINPAVRERITRTGGSDNNINERVYLYKVALAEIKARPLFGYGPGQGIKQKEYFEKLPENMRTLYRHPALHSFYLNFAADFGLAGLIIFVVIIVLIFKRLLTILHLPDSPANMFAFGLCWGLLGLLIGDCFDTILRGPGVAMEFFWALGIVFRLSKEKRS
jgi:O-antigen ligase